MPQKPRILFLITDLHLGGSPLMLATLAPGLSNNYDIHVASLAPLPDTLVPTRLRAANIPLHSLNLESVSAKNAAAGLVAYRNLLDTLKPDLVYSILIHANALATLGKQFHPHKLIHAIHTLQPEPRWHWTLQGAIANSADAIFAPSQAILDKIAEFGTFHRGVTIPNGIDTAAFATAKPILPLPPIPLPNRPLRLGYVGRFDPVKRLDLLLAAVNQLKLEAELYFIGYGEQQEALTQHATLLQIAPHVHFPGPTDNPAGWYKSFDIHVLPSPVEGFGLTLAESLAAGTPVVAVESPATAKIVRQNIDGVLIPKADEASLILGIKQVKAMLGRGAYAPKASQNWIADHFSAQAMIAAHLHNLEKIFRD